MPLLHLNPRQALTLVAGPWVLGQVYYHQSNAQTQGALDRFAEWLASRLNYTVVGLVLIDLAVLGAYLCHTHFHGLLLAPHRPTRRGGGGQCPGRNGARRTLRGPAWPLRPA